MTYKGVAKGKIIELEQPLPYEEGRHITVSVEPTKDSSCVSSSARVLRALRKPPQLDPANVDELEQAIQAGKLPIQQSGVFDSGQ